MSDNPHCETCVDQDCPLPEGYRTLRAQLVKVTEELAKATAENESLDREMDDIVDAMGEVFPGRLSGNSTVDILHGIKVRVEQAEKERDEAFALQKAAWAETERVQDELKHLHVPIARYDEVLARAEQAEKERDEAQGELRAIDAAMARRPALDEPTRADNILKAISWAGRADRAEAERDSWKRRAEEAEKDRDNLYAARERLNRERAADMAATSETNAEIVSNYLKASTDRDSLRSQLGVAQGQVERLRQIVGRALDFDDAEADCNEHVCRGKCWHADARSTLRDTSPKTPAEAQTKTPENNPGGKRSHSGATLTSSEVGTDGGVNRESASVPTGAQPKTEGKP